MLDPDTVTRWFIFSFILFISGFIMLLIGCNDNVKGGCLIKNIENANISNSYIAGKSDGYGFDLYYVVIKYTYNVDSNCHQEGHKHSNKKKAEKDLEKYPIGSEKRIVVKDVDKSSCTDDLNKWLDIWYTGVSFLCVVALIDIILVINYITIYWHKNCASHSNEKNQYINFGE